MANGPKRIQVPLDKTPRQDLENIAKHESRSVVQMATVLLELGISAHKQGYTIKNGALKKVQLKAVG